MHQHVATRRSDKSLRVNWKIFVKISVSATEFCRSNMLQKIKSDRICATFCGDKILLQRQRFSPNFSSTHEVLVPAICRCNKLLQLVAGPVHTELSVAATCCCNLSPSVYRPLMLPKSAPERGHTIGQYKHIQGNREFNAT